MRPALCCVLLAILAASVASAKPPPPAENQRHREEMSLLKKFLAAGPESDKTKFERLGEAMRREPDADYRRDLLALAAVCPGGAREPFLIGVLRSDGDCITRSAAATLLGRFGSEAAMIPLTRAAATDAVTAGMSECIRTMGTARRAAIFALAELGGRLPASAKAIADEIRKLPDTADADKQFASESLPDARRQALFQLTQDRTLLLPFFERLKSRDAKIRSDGVVAFRFLKLTTAPAELIALARDPSEDVRSWAALVLGEIGDAKTVPVLMALAKDASLDRGTRCNAIGSLGRMRSTDAKSLMEALLSDESLTVNAAIALSEITGKRHPLVPEGYGGPQWPNDRGK